MKGMETKSLNSQEQMIINAASDAISEHHNSILKKFSEKYVTVKKESKQQIERIQDSTAQLINDWMNCSPKYKQ
jgi:hypothetical protein